MDQPLGIALIAGPAAAIGALGTWLAIHRHDLLGAWRYSRRHRPPPIEVLIGDRRRRRDLEQALRAAIRQLDGAQGVAAPASALIVQRIVWDGWGGDGGRQIHGCARRPARFAADPRPRLCLALEVDGRALPLDEILATLAELWTLHLKGDDRDFVPISLGTATPPPRSAPAPASRRRMPLPLPADE